MTLHRLVSIALIPSFKTRRMNESFSQNFSHFYCYTAYPLFLQLFFYNFTFFNILPHYSLLTLTTASYHLRLLFYFKVHSTYIIYSILLSHHLPRTSHHPHTSTTIHFFFFIFFSLFAHFFSLFFPHSV